MNAIITVTIGKKYERIAAVTHPTLRSYADKIGAEFIIINNKTEEDIVPHFAKLQCQELLMKYDRIIFMDTDIIVRADCPNLFEVVPPEKVGIFMEGQFIPRRKMDLEMASRTYSTPILGIKSPEDWKGEYYNSGVMVVSRCHRTIFTPPDFDKMRKVEGAWDYGEQGWINLQLINGSVPIHRLSHRFNRMSVMDEITGEHRLMSFVIHYAGAPDTIKTEEGELDISEFIQRDIDKWNSGEVFKRGIYIRVGGGMGDQVDAEPVVRKLTQLYAGCDIIVASDWPRIFEHINAKICKVSDVGTIMTQDQPYYKMETLPIPESMFGMAVSHPLVHSTDYSSLSCLKTTLEDKTIKLRTTIEDANGLINKIGIENVQRLNTTVAIHPGRGWTSKTFPAAWWQEVIDGIAKFTTVCLIGKDIGTDQGLVDVKCPENGIDLRNQTTVGEFFLAISAALILVSNDSAPIHIAGAFDNWIVALPTCKHPLHILPWRKGTQQYKTVSLYKKLLVNDICNLPTQVYGETIDWIPSGATIQQGMELDYKDQLKGGDILEYIPEPIDVIKTVLNIRSTNVTVSST